MDYKLLSCEECENLVSVEDNGEPTFVCPACGTINDRDRMKSYTGQLVITSEEIKCGLDTDDEESALMIFDAEQEILDALTVLSKYGWTMKFRGNAKKD